MALSSCELLAQQAGAFASQRFETQTVSHLAHFAAQSAALCLR